MQTRSSQVFTPVTLKMLHDAPIGPDDNLEIDGASISEIIVCGRLISRIEEAMRVVFEINDNTGCFKVIFY